MKKNAIVYCENEIGKIDGKVANGLVRHSLKYNIREIIDSSKLGLETDEYSDGVKNGIPIFSAVGIASDYLDLLLSVLFMVWCLWNHFLTSNKRKYFLLQ